MPAVDAVLLAGDRRGARPIEEENKAFITFRGEPLVLPVIRATLSSESVGDTYVVGPARRLQALIERSCLTPAELERVHVVEQRQNLLENTKAGFVASLRDVPPSTPFGKLRASAHAATRALFLPCDIPLVTPWEIDQFIRGADPDYDYTIGLTFDHVMEHYYPMDDRPGIKMDYYHLRDGRFRHNNMHIGKPLRVRSLIHIERMYEARYQKRFLNIMRVFGDLLLAGPNAFTAFRFFSQMQLARVLHGTEATWLYELFRKGTTLSGAMRCIGDIMGMTMHAVFTDFGGATLDVDNEGDLQTATEMAAPWMRHQEEIHRRIGRALPNVAY